MATNAVQRLKKEKKVRFAEPISTQKNLDISVENTLAVNVTDKQNEQVDSVVHQLDKLHMEALRCMDVHCEANEWRLNVYNVRADTFDCLMQIAPAVSATIELDHAHVHVQTLFDEIVTKWHAKMDQINARLSELTDASNHLTEQVNVNDGRMTSAFSSNIPSLETSELVN